MTRAQRVQRHVAPRAMKGKPSPLLSIFFTVFLDMLSFGMVIPDIQLRGERLGAHGAMIGLVIATFSLAQLLTAPLLGRLSDLHGRRRVLLLTTVLATASFLFYANAHALWAMFAARVFAGIAGANIGVAYAYIADVTKPEERSKGMGLVGAAFGMGFVFGPVTGAALVRLGHGEPDLLGYTAAVLAALNFVFVYLFVPEPASHRESPTEGSRIAQLRRAFASAELRLLLILFVVANFAFSNLESTFFRLVTGRFAMSQMDGAFVLVFVGLVAALMQGGAVRRLGPRFGDVRLLRAGYILQAPALAGLAFAPPWVPMLLASLVLGIGSGMSQPSLGSLISKRAPATMQGGVFGVTQALGAFARIVGPLLGNVLFDMQTWLPYVVAGVLMLVPISAAFAVRENPMGESATSRS
ncbi:MAG: MFS transporter [Fimbriimonadaceae bacterium]|nr:MFS transporter [Fimbriimonadaceae bacterium]